MLGELASVVNTGLETLSCWPSDDAVGGGEDVEIEEVCTGGETSDSLINTVLPSEEVSERLPPDDGRTVGWSSEIEFDTFITAGTDSFVLDCETSSILEVD